MTLPSFSSARLRPTPTWHEWALVVGYFSTGVGLVVLGTAIGTLLHGEPTLHSFVSHPLFFLGTFVYAPPLLAIANTIRGNSILSSICIGVVPGILFLVLAILTTLFGISGQGDSPLWALSLVFLGVGLAGAIGGTVLALFAGSLRERV